jgi:MYXO-CTERM domain-containing protein
MLCNRMTVAALATTLASAFADHASAALLLFSDPSGLSAEVEFTIINAGNGLQIRIRNTSTNVPGGFSAADQLLTGVSWDAGALGINGGDVQITGGSVVTGPNSQSWNFSVLNVGANADVSGEYGYGNNDGSGALPNFVSGNNAGNTPYGGANLDATVNLDGPQAGLVSSAFSVPLGGLGAIEDEIIHTVSLSQTINNLDVIIGNGVRVEFGSDAAFLTGELVPAPGALALLGLAGVIGRRRRRN